jgi:hypothetical protein
MNNTLAAIGIHDSEHRKGAIAVGEKIGQYRDWPVSKGCTPALRAGMGGGHGEAAGLSRPARHIMPAGQSLYRFATAVPQFLARYRDCLR